MPFSSTNAPIKFDRLIDGIFVPECEPNVFGYLDDIIIATNTFEEHMYCLELVQRSTDDGLVVNREKYEFCCSRVKYLGFLLDKEIWRLVPEIVSPVLEYPAPRTVKQSRRFSRMVAWYARFIDRVSELLKIPLLRLLHKTNRWQWGEEQQEAFDALKKALMEPPVLARPDFSKPFTVQRDASKYAIGVVSTQEGEDGDHPIVYASRVLSKAERNYTVTKKEVLGGIQIYIYY